MELSDHDIAEEDGSEGYLNFGDKKRKLTFEQVKTLEESFELGNKLELDRKMLLAKALGMQPRQIAVWFQNRRARWKTKQLERNFDALKQDYDSLKGMYEILLEENRQLKDKVQRLISEQENNDWNSKVGGYEIEPHKNSANSVLKPTIRPMELSLEPEICTNCTTEPLRDAYNPMTRKIQEDGCCTDKSEPASSIFNIDYPVTIESPQSQGVPRTPVNSNSSPLLLEGSGIGEQVSGALKTPPRGHESQCLPKVEDDSAWFSHGEQTSCNLFHNLEEQGALMLWEYWHLPDE